MITVRCVASDEELRRNREYAASLGLPRLAAAPERSTPLAVVGGGQSALDYLDDILSWPGEVMAINGAYDWLQDHGRIAEWVMGTDPLAELADLYRRPQDATTFLMATSCHPDVFNALHGQKIAVYGLDEVRGGPTAMSRASFLAAMLGYRKVTLFGADSCYCGDVGHVYGGTLADEINPPIRVKCDGRTWVTHWGLLAQAEYLSAMADVMALARVTQDMAGDHLASAIFKTRRWTYEGAGQ